MRNKQMHGQMTATTCARHSQIINDYVLTLFYILVYVYLLTVNSFRICTLVIQSLKMWWEFLQLYWRQCNLQQIWSFYPNSSKSYGHGTDRRTDGQMERGEHKGGATIFNVGGTSSRAERAKKNFWPPPPLLAYLGGHKTGYYSFHYCNYDV